MKRFFLLCAVLCMLLVWTGVCAETVDATPLTLGEEAEAVISTEGAMAYFSYTPETTGTYVWTSMGSETSGCIYNSSMLEIARDDGSGVNANFITEAVLVAGRTYYFSANYYSQYTTGMFRVTLELKEPYEGHGLIYAVAADPYSKVLVNTPATLEVSAEVTDGDITYQWYKTGKIIEGAEASVYTTEPVTGMVSYRCAVTDAYGNTQDVWFAVEADNQLTAEAVGATDVRVPYGETTELAVSASCLYGEMSYQWRRVWTDDEGYHDETVQRGTSPSVTTLPVTGNIEYYCTVTDNYDNAANVYFHIQVDNQLVVQPVGSTDLSVKYGETTELAVTASCQTGDLKYQWYKQWQDADGWHQETIAEATAESVTTDAVTGRMTYYCQVSDEFGNGGTVWYYLRVDNQLTVNAVGDTKMTVNPEGTVELAVTASCLNGELTYAWYKGWNDTEGYHSEIVENATSDSITTDPITQQTVYDVYVSDMYGNSQNVYFVIRIDNQFTASAVGDTDRTAYVGDTIALAVDASCQKGDLTYQWYKSFYNGESWSETIVENATSSSITTEPITNRTSYYCHVSDLYGNTQDVWFQIGIDNQLTVESVGTTEKKVNPGETVELAVTASCRNGDLTYQWHKCWSEGNDWHDEIVENATSESVTTVPITRRMEYYCEVVDMYGNNQNAWFQIAVENLFTAEALGGNELQVALGETARLEVEASCKTGDLTYKWYKEGNEENNWRTELIENATTASITTEPITERTEYYCNVRDMYGNFRNVDFYIGIENGLRVSPVGSTEPKVNPGATAELAVTASCRNGELTYEWYKGGNEENDWQDERIENATTDSITTDVITKRTTYYCRVSDMYGNYKHVWFYVGIDNQFTMNSVGSTELTVVSGGTAELKVAASCANGEVTYQWNREWREGNSWYSESIPGATSDSYTTPPVERQMRYYCRGVDMYGNQRDVYFTVGIDNALTADAAGPSSLTVPTGGTAELAVKASCREGKLNYQWYREWKTDDGWRSEIIEGATGTSVTTEPLSRAMQYYCVITDMYGNETNVWFNIGIDNQFSARAVGSNRLTVLPGKTAELEVTASCAQGELNYEWWKVTRDSNGNWLDETQLTSVTATLTTEPITKYTEYYCDVSDDYGNSKNVWFYISVDNQLVINRNEMTTHVEVTPGETAVLSVIASCASGDLSYQWYQNVQTGEDRWDNVLIPGATSSSYTTEAVSTTVEYFCVVSDMYGNNERVWFIVVVDNQLNVWAVSEQEIHVAQGERVVLSADASCAQGSLRYQWRQKRYYNDGNWEYVNISGGTGKTLTIESVAEGAEYTLTVTDEYNNTEAIDFIVQIENGLKVVWDSHPTVEYGASVTLEVDAVCASGDLTYSWSVDYEPDPSVTGPAYTLDNVTGYIEVYCLVKDKYGNAQDCYFSVEPHDEISIQNSVSINGQAAEDRAGQFKINSGDSAAVTVTATSSLGSDVSYSWWINDERVDVTGNTCSIPNITGFTSVSCEMEVPRGNGDSDYYQRYFYFILENHLKVEAVGTRVRRINAGEEVTLEVKASADSGTFTYEWTDSSDNKLGNQKALKVTPKASETYFCEVKDAYGMSVYCDFIVVVGSSNDLALDKTVKVQTEGSSTALYYFYTPAANGIYTLRSTGSLYPSAYVYDMNREQLAYAYSGGGNRTNFVLTCQLEAGKTYLYRVRCYSKGTFGITLTRDEDATVPTGYYVLRKGQTVRLPLTDVSSISSETPAILSVAGNSVSALQNGTGTLKVNWTSGSTSTYRFIVSPGSVMTMPGALRTIESEAFAGDKAVRFVELSAQTQSVESFAFQGSSLAQIVIPGTGTKLATSAFYGIQPTVLCKEGSEAEKWCVNRNLRYLYID